MDTTCPIPFLGCQNLQQTKTGLKSPLCWPGGKSKLVNELKKRIPPHKIYVEPFAGGAQLFFSKEPSEVNVISDVDPELIAFYRKLSRYSQPLACDMKPDREKFEKIKAKKNKTVCDYLYLNKNSFSCNMNTISPNRLLKKCKGDFINCNIKILAHKIDEVKDFLRRAEIESRDFREVLRKYDSPETFFYVDPPYVGPNKKECLYRKYCEVTPREVAEAVKNLKGKVLVSYDDHADVRGAFKGSRWKMERVKMPYSFEQIEPGGKKREGVELLIRNY